MNSPIALFLYNRLNHAVQTIDALKKCTESAQTQLYVFIDGPKSKDDKITVQKVDEVRAFAKNITGFLSVEIMEHPQNIGLSNSIVYGISNVLSKHSSIIVIEDDISVGHDFLKFMNVALKKYENESKVAGISGFSFPINERQPFFSRTGSCWGWGTYKRVWDDFLMNRNNLNMSDLTDDQLKLFNVYGNFYEHMFKQQKQGLIQSWAVVFYLYYFSKKQYFLFAGSNLIDNTGFDGSGSHKKNGNFLTDNNPMINDCNLQLPEHISETKKIRKKINMLYKNGLSKPHLLKQIWHRLFSI